tara:strand:+ start:730 stop:1455 length:726 start_codon:yes stop_codon:yes gene_type:complete
MSKNYLKKYYEEDSERFWDPSLGFADRDLDIYPFLKNLSGTILEYGCGSGSLLYNLYSEKKFNKAYGVDISERALNKLNLVWQKNYPNNNYLNLILPKDDKIPQIKSNSIDVIVCVATIEHVINPYIVLDELHRIAKKDAYLICSVPNYQYLKNIFYLILGKQPRTGTDLPVSHWRKDGWDGMHLHTFVKSSFKTLLNDCSWEPIKWKGCGKKFNWTGLGYLRKNFPAYWSGELITLCKKK